MNFKIIGTVCTVCVAGSAILCQPNYFKKCKYTIIVVPEAHAISPGFTIAYPTLLSVIH